MHLKSPSTAFARVAGAGCAGLLLLHVAGDHDVGSVSWWLVTWPLMFGLAAGLWVTTAVGLSHRMWSLVMAACAALMVMPSARADRLEGNWLTQGGDGVIAIRRCPEGLCGRIAGFARSVGGPDRGAPTDFQGRPMCGLRILVAAPGEAGTWNGRITDPETGKAWTCSITLDASGRLHLRGYLLLPELGQTQIWTRATTPPRPDCAIRVRGGAGGNQTSPPR
jgi:uncharacterized protein (DUF2147 family)